MTRAVILWAAWVAVPVVVLARFIANRLDQRRDPHPRTLADTLAEQNQPSNVVPLRAGPNRKRSA